MIRREHRRAFTLIELMVSMAIASLLAATALLALWGAQQSAIDARSHAQVAKINDLIMSQWETYPSRKLAILYNYGPGPRDKLQARLALLRDTMRMELPDRITDLSTPKVTVDLPLGITPVIGAAQLRAEPRLWRAYRRRCLKILGPDANDPTIPNWSKWSQTFQGAECLYLILAEMRDDETSALSFFRDTEISDLDNDGMAEIIDGWGNPISFLRWAPSYASDIQILSRDRQPDPFDQLNVDPRWNPNWTPATPAPYTLFPLIYSAGPDEEYGLITDNASGTHTYAATSPIPMDPYAPVSGNIYIGDDDLTGASQDNITNHFIEVR